MFVTTGAVPAQMDWQWTVSAEWADPTNGPWLHHNETTSSLEICWELLGNLNSTLKLKY